MTTKAPPLVGRRGAGGAWRRGHGKLRRRHTGCAHRRLSALKRSYRDLLRAAAPDVVFVHLSGTAATIAARMDARAYGFMPRTLLESQLATLENPGTR
ncbi:hypothetical protein [Pseudarthrobacter sp. SL88]|uniref:hypothetical protein n=1 Tax=Pseudarthrobacter sp. SL88 TaxID=2994666 RepID=UPI002DD43068|nr:hypothetical protein [Pseudarthrobacter sp. SL88]